MKGKDGPITLILARHKLGALLEGSRMLKSEIGNGGFSARARPRGILIARQKNASCPREALLSSRTDVVWKL